jgi:hypothetical protein
VEKVFAPWKIKDPWCRIQLIQGTLFKSFNGGVSVENTEKKEKLLREYGYPEEAIPRLMEEISTMSYDRVRKLILPYNDITADKS